MILLKLSDCFWLIERSNHVILCDIEKIWNEADILKLIRRILETKLIYADIKHRFYYELSTCKKQCSGCYVGIHCIYATIMLQNHAIPQK